MPAALDSTSHSTMPANHMYAPPAPSAASEPLMPVTEHCSGSIRGGGPISELQELVQQDRRFPVCSNRPILKWEFDTRMANAVTLQFRATVSFVHSGIPHHATGAWHSSKKNAQRDAAERVLAMLRGQFNNVTEGLCDKSLKWSGSAESSAIDKLAVFCATLAGQQHAEPHWSFKRNGAGWQATVEVCVFGDVVHTLQGATCNDKQSAMEDTAKRALWYLKDPSHVNAFEVSSEAVVQEALEVPSSELWLREGMVAEADLHRSETQQRAAEQKTTLMRVQNQLQKRYGKDLPTGASVWEWSYEYAQVEPNLTVMPHCRAKVWIAGLNKEFQGQWCRGQKQAQLHACAQVTEYLDAENH